MLSSEDLSTESVWYNIGIGRRADHGSAGLSLEELPACSTLDALSPIWVRDRERVPLGVNSREVRGGPHSCWTESPPRRTEPMSAAGASKIQRNGLNSRWGDQPQMRLLD